ncbi:glycosyl hydrolase catalytic core domain-containing protein [Trichoderma ceciliae]
MYKAVALTSIAALAGQAMALNAHRHEHHMEKRALKTDWCTVWETVYVTVDPGASTPAAVAATSFAAQDVPLPTGAKPTVTSTSIVVVVPSAAAASSPEAPATKATTTLITAVRQSSAAPIETSIAPAPSSAPESSSEQAAPTTTAPQPTSEKATPTPSSVETPSSHPPPPPSTTSKAAPSATPSKPASPPPSGGGAFPAKRGMAYNDGNLANTFGAASGKMGWVYNWGFWPSGIDTSKYSYVPMLWSNAPDHTNGFDAQVEILLGSGTSAIFSINEPDIASQANMSPGAAASAHAQWLNKYSGKALIGAPAVSNSNIPGQGLDWLQNFVDACNSLDGGCVYDFCNVHWYSPASAIDTFFSQIEGASKICGGKPIVISEWAPSGSDEEIISFLEEALPKLDALDYVMGYAYFMVSAGSLMSSTTSLSDYGNIYATA